MAYRSIALLAFGVSLMSGCTLDPNPGVYCDGTSKWKCTDPKYPFCDVSQKRCVVAPDAGMCTVNPMACVDGGGLDQMGDDMPPPDLAPQCTSSASCPNAMPICGNARACRACASSGDDAQCAEHNAAIPHCDAASGQCVACTPGNNMQSSQCTTAAPICDSTETCRKCNSNNECPSFGTWPEGDSATGICNSDGTCAAASQVAFVDNRGNTTTCPTGHPGPAGTLTDPYCDISAGVSSTKSTVLIRGQTPMAMSAYGKVSITASRTVTIVGPGQGAAAPVSIIDLSNDEFTVNVPGGATAIVVVDGIEIGDRTNPTAQNGVSCNAGGGGTAKLTLLRSALQHSGKFGLTATNCDVTMDQDVVQNNTNNGGLQFTNSDFTVENSVIALNGGAASTLGGIQMSGNGPSNRAQLVNITVADNTAKNQVGVYSGVDCGGTAPLMFNVVVANNANNSINPSCTLAYSSFAGGTGTNHDITGCSDAQLFVNTGANLYQPLPTTTGTCVLLGKGTSSYKSVTAPDHDLLGAHRPQPAGSMPDDGAYEGP